MNEYSVWFIPSEPWLGIFRMIISNISKKYGTFSFEPHITIIVKNSEEQEMIKIIEELSKQITKTTIRFTEICQEDYYFRALYLKAERENLFPIHTLASKITGMLADLQRTDAPGHQNTYMPHMSLLYGDIDQETKKDIVKSVDTKANDAYASTHIPVEIEFDKIELWLTGRDILVSEWKKVAEFSCQK